MSPIVQNRATLVARAATLRVAAAAAQKQQENVGLIDPVTGNLSQKAVPTALGECFITVPVSSDPITNGQHLRSAAASIKVDPYGKEGGFGYYIDGGYVGRTGVTLILPPGRYAVGSSGLVIPSGVNICALGGRGSVVLEGNITISGNLTGIVYSVDRSDPQTLKITAPQYQQVYEVGSTIQDCVFLSYIPMYESAICAVELTSDITRLRFVSCVTTGTWITVGRQNTLVEIVNSNLTIHDLICTTLAWDSDIVSEAYMNQSYEHGPMQISGGSLRTSYRNNPNSIYRGVSIVFTPQATSTVKFEGTFQNCDITFEQGDCPVGLARFDACKFAVNNGKFTSLASGAKPLMHGCRFLTTGNLLVPNTPYAMSIVGCSFPYGYVHNANLTLADGTFAGCFNIVRASGYY